MAARSNTPRLFNTLRRKMLRRRISSAETLFGAGFLGLLGLVTLWTRAQKDNFDPQERDLSDEALARGTRVDTLYRSPVKRFREDDAVSSSAPGSAVDLGVFPASVLEGDWQVDGRVQTFEPANLFEKINGAAEQFLSFGFKKMHFLTLKKASQFINLELYDQGELANALGIFSAQREPTQAVRAEGGLTFYETAIGAIGILGPYYFKLTGDSSGPLIQEKAKQLLSALAALPVDAQAVDRAFQLLVGGLKLPFQAIAYEKTNALQFDFLSKVWFGTVDDKSGARVLVMDAGSDAAAKALLDRVVQEQLHEHKALATGATGALLEHEYLKTVFGIRQRGGVLYGVDGMTDKAQAETWLKKLEGALQQG